MEISAKTGVNVKEAFYKMAFEVNEVQKRKISSKSTQARGPYAETSDSLGGQAVKITLKPKEDEQSNIKRKKKCC